MLIRPITPRAQVQEERDKTYVLRYFTRPQMAIGDGSGSTLPVDGALCRAPGLLSISVGGPHLPDLGVGACTAGVNMLPDKKKARIVCYPIRTTYCPPP